jgi:hypothetical protein
MATSGGTRAYANEARSTRSHVATKSEFPPTLVPVRTAAGRSRASQLPPGAFSPDDPRRSDAGMRPSQVPVRDGTRPTGSPALTGGRAHHGRQGLRPSAASIGAATAPARPGLAPLRPMPVSAQIQRCGGIQCPPGTCDHDQGETAHRSGDGTSGPAQIPPSVATVLGTPGRTLDAATRSGVEARLGHDFGQVRIHTDAEAARSAHAIHAQAYTLGRHVVMGQGRYQPHAVSGMQLLIHELTHVIQQGNPAADTGPARAISHHHDPAEREADHIAGTLTGSPGASGSPGLVQRQDDDDTDVGTSTPVTDVGTSTPDVGTSTPVTDVGTSTPDVGMVTAESAVQAGSSVQGGPGVIAPSEFDFAPGPGNSQETSCVCVIFAYGGGFMPPMKFKVGVIVTAPLVLRDGRKLSRAEAQLDSANAATSAANRIIMMLDDFLISPSEIQPAFVDIMRGVLTATGLGYRVRGCFPKNC